MAWWTEQRLHPKAKSKFVVVFGSNFFIPSVKTVGKPKIDFDTKEYRLLNHKFNYPGNGTWQPIELKFVDMNGLGDKNDTFDTSAFLWQILNNTGYAYPYLDGGSNVSNNPYYNNVQNEQVGSNGGHHIATKLSFGRDDASTTEIVERGKSFRTITTPEKSSTIANSFGKGLDGRIDNKSAHYSKQKISIYQLSPEGADLHGEGAKIVECWHLVNPIVKSIGWGDLSYDSDELVEYSLNIVYDWAIYDRKAIGTTFVPDAQPYRDFMKSYALAQISIDEERITQEQEAILRDFNEREGVPDYDSYDINKDGKIDKAEAQKALRDARELLEDQFIEEDGEIFFDRDGNNKIDDIERLFGQENQELIKDAHEDAEDFEEEAAKKLADIIIEETAENLKKIQEEFEEKQEQRAEAERIAKEEAEELKTYTDDYAAQTIELDNYENPIELSDGALDIVNEVKEPISDEISGSLSHMDPTPKEAGSGGFDALGEDIGGGGTVELNEKDGWIEGIGEATDELIDIDTYTGERTQSENVGTDSLTFNPLGDYSDTEPSEPYTTDPNLDYEDDQTFIIRDRPRNREDDPDWEPLEEGPSYQESSNVLDPGYDMPTDPREDPRYRPEERDPQLEIVPAPRAPQEDTEIDPADQDDTLDD